MNPTDSSDDSAIVAAVLAGDREQFEELVRRYRGPLLRVAVSRVGKPQWAEDLVQETFLAAFKSLHTYNSKYSFRTWLWTILLNQCRRALAKHQRRESIVAQAATNDRWEGELEDPCGSPEDAFAAGDRRRRLDLQLRQLPEDQAIALRLRFFGELKFQEIADTMQCSLTTAKARVRLGLQTMSARMTDEVASSEGKEASPTNEKEKPPGNGSAEELI